MNTLALAKKPRPVRGREGRRHGHASSCEETEAGEREGGRGGGRGGGRACLGVDDCLPVVGHEADEARVPLVGDFGEGGGALGGRGGGREGGRGLK